MKFGLHYLMSTAPGQSPAQRYRDTIAQAVHGEALGFESAWPVEQHFSPAASISPCPALLLAAIAARTSTLRLGTAIVQLPLTHPLRVAEEIATLDVLSGGRVEFGVGRGSNPLHFAGLGVPLAESRGRFIEGLALIREAWGHERFSFAGRFYQADDLTLAPRPLQQPHPPIRIAANSAETAAFAGRAGLPILVALNVNPLPRMRALLPAYHQARAEAGHAPARDDDLTMLMPLYVGADPEQVRRDVEPSLAHYLEAVRSMTAILAERAGSAAERQQLEATLAQMVHTSYETVNDVMGVFDTPAACVERLLAVREEFGAGRVIAWFNFGGQIPHERVLQSMELFAARVMPHLGT